MNKRVVEGSALAEKATDRGEVWELSPAENAHLAAVMAQIRLGTSRAVDLERQALQIEQEVRGAMARIADLRKEAAGERAAVAAGETGLMTILARARQIDPARVQRVNRRRDGTILAFLAEPQPDPVHVGGGASGASSPAEARADLPAEALSAPAATTPAQEAPTP